MKVQKRDGKVTADELLEQIKRLQNEFFVADVQFEMFVGLQKAGPIYKDEFRCSPLFWDYTFQAHINMVVLRLCRIYDTDDKTFSLPNFLKTIEANRELFSKAAFMERNKGNPNLERLAKYPRELSMKGLEDDLTPKNWT
ncbi:MAG: hypothetical protein ABSD57_04185 [Verrucomicrobiota bacterium]|jgi:hypothetical protein